MNNKYLLFLILSYIIFRYICIYYIENMTDSSDITFDFNSPSINYSSGNVKVSNIHQNTSVGNYSY